MYPGPALLTIMRQPWPKLRKLRVENLGASALLHVLPGTLPSLEHLTFAPEVYNPNVSDNLLRAYPRLGRITGFIFPTYHVREDLEGYLMLTSRGLVVHMDVQESDALTQRLDTADLSAIETLRVDARYSGPDKLLHALSRKSMSRLHTVHIDINLTGVNLSKRQMLSLAPIPSLNTLEIAFMGRRYPNKPLIQEMLRLGGSNLRRLVILVRYEVFAHMAMLYDILSGSSPHLFMRSLTDLVLRLDDLTTPCTSSPHMVNLFPNLHTYVVDVETGPVNLRTFLLAWRQGREASRFTIICEPTAEFWRMIEENIPRQSWEIHRLTIVVKTDDLGGSMMEERVAALGIRILKRRRELC